VRRLDLVVGPNGAGKSTFIRFTLVPSLPPSTVSVNADEIARHRWPDSAEAHSYEAAEIAAQTRTSLIAAGRSFIAETVFSHPSKLELIDQAHAAGYTVVLHVVLVPEELTVTRVALRVRSGGHSVPEDKIRQRYQRLWPLVASAIQRADTTTVYDNSTRQGPRIVARLSGGLLVGAVSWPAWAPAALVASGQDG
jgi:predicted ABC-type ATPase